MPAFAEDIAEDEESQASRYDQKHGKQIEQDVETVIGHAYIVAHDIEASVVEGGNREKCRVAKRIGKSIVRQEDEQPYDRSYRLEQHGSQYDGFYNPHGAAQTP